MPMETLICPVCGTVFDAETWRHRKYCHIDCFKKYRKDDKYKKERKLGPMPEEQRRKIGKGNKNKIVTKETRNKMSDSQTKRHGNPKTEPKYCELCNKIFYKGEKERYVRWEKRFHCSTDCRLEAGPTDEARENMSKASKNKKKSEKHVQNMIKNHKGMLDKTQPESSKQKCREARIKDAENKYGSCCPNYNKNACKLFDKINLEFGLNLQHAENGGEFCIIGYFVDGIDFENKLIIEFDEKYHSEEKQKKRDIIRQSNLIEKTGFMFIRIDENVDFNEKNWCF